MSKEYFNYQPEYYSYYDRLELIEDIAKEVAARLESFDGLKVQQTTPEDTPESVASQVRGAQLAFLSQYVLGLAQYENNGESIDLDDSRLINPDLYMPDHFMLSPLHPLVNPSEYRSAIETGEKQGTSDLLELLTPAEVIAPSARENYFSPWNKDMISRRFRLHDNGDGSATLFQPTKLPGIAVKQNYPAGEKLPKRTIGLLQNMVRE